MDMPVEPANVQDGAGVEDAATLCARVCGCDLPRVREMERFARERGQSLIGVLVERGEIDETSLLKGLSGLLDQPFVASGPAEVSPQTLAMIPPSLAIRSSRWGSRRMAGCTWRRRTRLVGKPGTNSSSCLIASSPV